MSVSSTRYAHFQGSKGSRNRSKYSSKIIKNRWKKMSGNAMFFVIVFGTFFSQISWIWAPFWSLDGHFGAFKIASFQGTRPRWSPRSLLDQFWDHLDQFWKGFRRFGGHFWKALGRHLGERWQETLRKRIDMNPFRNFDFWTKWLTLCVGCNKMQTEFGRVLEECT